MKKNQQGTKKICHNQKLFIIYSSIQIIVLLPSLPLHIVCPSLLVSKLLFWADNVYRGIFLADLAYLSKCGPMPFPCLLHQHWCLSTLGARRSLRRQKKKKSSTEANL